MSSHDLPDDYTDDCVSHMIGIEKGSRRIVVIGQIGRDELMPLLLLSINTLRVPSFTLLGLPDRTYKERNARVVEEPSANPAHEPSPLFALSAVALPRAARASRESAGRRPDHAPLLRRADSSDASLASASR